MGRKPLPSGSVVTIRVTLSLRRGADDDLIAALDRIPARKRAAAVAAALRGSGLRVAPDASEQEKDQVLDRLGELLNTWADDD